MSENKEIIGYNDELGPGGEVTKSKMRQMSGIALYAALIYIAITVIVNIWFWNKIFKLSESKILTENILQLMLTQFTGIDILVFISLLIAAFVPKALQKFAEMNPYKKV